MSSFDVLNVGLDAYSVALCVLLGVHALLERDARLRTASLCFAGLCFSNAVMALGDMTSWAPPPPLDEAGFVVVVAGSFAFYFAIVFLYAFLIGYLVAFFGQRTRRSASDGPSGAPVFPRSALVPPFVVLVAFAFVCVASLFADVLFTVTPEGGYARGPLFWVSQVTIVVLHLYGSGLIVSQARRMSMRERLAFASWVLLPIVANGVQVLNFGLSVTNAAIAFSLLIMFIGIQSERRALLAARDEELAEMRGSMMLSQIQPHFLYNALTAIRELCRTDAEAAADMVTDFAAYLRENMQSLDSKAPIPLAQELAHTKTYLAIESRRYGERLKWEFDVRADGFALPPLSVQPLVENAVRHGIAPLEQGGTVRIGASAREDGALVVTVEDDGAGFEVGEACGEGHVGIANVRRRVEALCDGSLDVESAPGSGTRATLVVPQRRGREQTKGRKRS